MALFGVAHFIPRNDFPTTEYLLGYGTADWSRYFQKEKQKEEQTEQEQRESDWDKLCLLYTSRVNTETFAQCPADSIDYAVMELSLIHI